MNTKQTNDHNKTDYQPETNLLMEAFNPQPVQADHPTHFYWQTWQNRSSDEGVQETFEN